MVTIRLSQEEPNKMVDGGSNVCITDNLGILLNVVNIDPIQISVALARGPTSYDDCITKWELLPLTLTNGTCYYQPCYYCANLVETIISPSAILASSNVFVQWQKIGYNNPTVPGSIRFSSHDSLALMFFNLHCRDGLYYFATDVYTVNQAPVHIHCHCAIVAPPQGVNPAHCPPFKFTRTSHAQQVESEVWALRFGSPGKQQLNILPQHVIVTPSVFKHHPFRLIDFKEQAYIWKQVAGKTAERILTDGSEFFMDFGFMHASTDG
jgi:hypothetical protein